MAFQYEKQLTTHHCVDGKFRPIYRYNGIGGLPDGGLPNDYRLGCSSNRKSNRWFDFIRGYGLGFGTGYSFARRGDWLVMGMSTRAVGTGNGGGRCNYSLVIGNNIIELSIVRAHK